MKRRQLIKYAFSRSLVGLGALGLNRLFYSHLFKDGMGPVFKEFSLQYPKHLSTDEAQHWITMFWDIEKISEIEENFIHSGEIIYIKHTKQGRLSKSLIGFRSVKSYQRWESTLNQYNCCDDYTLNQFGFRFSMKSFSLDPSKKIV